jgi:hypothetical protein
MKPVITDTIPDKKYPNMYRLQWRDGSQSVDFYSLTRAKDILRNYRSYIDAMKQSEAMAGNSLASRSKMVAGESLCTGM